MTAKTTKRSPLSKTKTTNIEVKAIQAALSLAALQGWADTTMKDIAQESGVSMFDLTNVFVGKKDILRAFNLMVDRAVLVEIDEEFSGEPIKDRLFDILMTRFEVLKPYKDGVAAILKDKMRDPIAFSCEFAMYFRASMESMLDAAEVPHWGPFRPLQVKGLTAIYAFTLSTWLRDNSDDTNQTMATLDRLLSRVDTFLGMINKGMFGDIRDKEGH